MLDLNLDSRKVGVFYAFAKKIIEDIKNGDDLPEEWLYFFMRCNPNMDVIIKFISHDPQYTKEIKDYKKLLDELNKSNK